MLRRYVSGVLEGNINSTMYVQLLNVYCAFEDERFKN